MKVLPYICSFISFPLIYLTMIYNQWYVLPIYSLVIVPFLDFIIPKQQPLTEQEIEKLQNDKTFEKLLYAWSLTYLITQIFCYHFVRNMNPAELIVSAFASGFLSSQSFTVAHEILHKKGKLNVIWANMLLMMNSYLHFYTAHKQVHHVHVATDKDPSSAPKGMTVYEFVPRSIFGNLIYLWISNPLLIMGTTIISVLYGYTLYHYHLNSLIFWIIQTGTAIVMVEIVNYIEHYGIRRIGSVSECHSWDSYHPFMNWILFRIGYHSQHHQFSSNNYQILNEKKNSLKLPFDYPLMMLISLYPKLFFYLTHSRLK